MKTNIFALLIVASAVQLSAVDYKPVDNWLKLPDGRAQIGPMHGDIAVSSKGEVYVSVMDTNAALQVYAPDGKFLRNVPNAPNDLHGFVIRKQSDGEFIYGPRLAGQTIVKMTLDGKIVLEIPASVIPDEFKNPPAAPKKKVKEDASKNSPPPKRAVRLTGMDIAPNGDWYVTDGYASSFIHHFDSKGKYLNSFGGGKEPYGFKTLHKIAIDTRFSPPRIIGCDRENYRVVHMGLDGKFLGVVASDILRPAAVAIRGDYAAIAEIKGQVTLLDKEGKVVAKFGTNTVPEESATNKVEPAKWRLGIFNAPHGIAFNDHGDIFVAEYTVYGRVHRFNLQ
jgi:hypothetical protein